MRVVGVHAHVIAQVLPVGAVLALVGAQDGLQAGGDEQVLLLEAQQLAVLAGVGRVQDRGDGLGVVAEAERTGVVAGVERVQIEVVLVGLGLPQAQAVYLGSAVAHDLHVVGNGEDLLGALGGKPVAAVLLVAHHVAAELHGDGTGGLAGLPGIAVLEPGVGLLDLTAVLDLLTEEAVAIAHAVAVAGDALLGHGVEEAGGQTTEAAVAQAGVALVACTGSRDPCPCRAGRPPRGRARQS